MTPFSMTTTMTTMTTLVANDLSIYLDGRVVSRCCCCCCCLYAGSLASLISRVLCSISSGMACRFEFLRLARARPTSIALHFVCTYTVFVHITHIGILSASSFGSEISNTHLISRLVCVRLKVLVPLSPDLNGWVLFVHVFGT